MRRLLLLPLRLYQRRFIFFLFLINVGPSINYYRDAFLFIVIREVNGLSIASMTADGVIIRTFNRVMVRWCLINVTTFRRLRISRILYDPICRICTILLLPNLRWNPT